MGGYNVMHDQWVMINQQKTNEKVSYLSHPCERKESKTLNPPLPPPPSPPPNQALLSDYATFV
jgi:hypothetical protein